MADSFAFGYSTKYYCPELNMSDFGMRWYSPEVGRFINRDPIEESGGDLLYGFCLNDGVNKWDYLGEHVDIVQGKDACDMIFRLNITIYYANNIEKRARTNLKDIARRIKQSIESLWNIDEWMVGCCYISFEANVATSNEIDPSKVSGDNKIAITSDAKLRRSVNDDNSSGTWSADNRSGSDWAFAHEAGHLMGLPDDYHEVILSNGSTITMPNAGHAGHMMAQHGGAANQHEVEDIIHHNSASCPCGWAIGN